MKEGTTKGDKNNDQLVLQNLERMVFLTPQKESSLMLGGAQIERGSDLGSQEIMGDLADATEWLPVRMRTGWSGESISPVGIIYLPEGLVLWN